MGPACSCSRLGRGAQQTVMLHCSWKPRWSQRVTVVCERGENVHIMLHRLCLDRCLTDRLPSTHPGTRELGWTTGNEETSEIEAELPSGVGTALSFVALVHSPRNHQVTTSAQLCQAVSWLNPFRPSSSPYAVIQCQRSCQGASSSYYSCKLLAGPRHSIVGQLHALSWCF